MNGVLLIDKPKGWTSFDVVAKIRGILRQVGDAKPKVGHSGTLDPLATGMLVVLVGSYCKKASEYSKLDKTYEVELKLGQTSSTDDGEGEKTIVSDKKPSDSDIKNAIADFIGTLEQKPPAYSAIKVGGKRAYKLARAGKEVKMEPRTVTIYSIEHIEYDYPYVRFTADVSSGTYIRSLARDIGEKLGTGAYMSGLRRISIGQFNINDAHKIGSLEPGNIAQNLL